MKETSRRITATSSSNERSMDQLGSRVLVKGIGVMPPAHTPLYNRFLGQIFKDDVNGFSSSDLLHIIQFITSYEQVTFKEHRNRFQEIESASLCSLAGRYDKPIPTQFLAPTDCCTIPALVPWF